MDRHRDRSGDGGGRHSRMPSRWSDGPPLGDQPPRHFNHSAGGRGGDGFSGGRHHPYRSGGGGHDYPPGGGGGGRSPSFRSGPAGYVGFGDEPLMQGGPRRGGGGGFGGYGRGGSPNDKDGSKFAKLFVGSVPRTATEEDIRPLFEEHGNVMEVALIRDKRTGQQQSCCFIKYATSEDADRAIQSLHNQVTLPGGMGPIQVRYADGERERTGAVEHKLFVGSLNKRATEKEVEEIFSPYGHVEDVYLMRDELKLSRGCGFVKFSGRDMAQAAINALNGVFTMRGCEQPLIVRFADPKRPRLGESRGGPAFGGPGFGSRSQAPLGFRSTSQFGEPIGGRFPPNAWSSENPESLAPSSQASPHVFSSSHLASMGGFPSTTATGFSSAPLAQPISQQISHMQMPPMSPQELPSSLHVPQNQLNSASHFPSQSFMATTQLPSQFQISKDQQNVHMQHSQSSSQQFGQLPIQHSAGFPNFPQTLPSHLLHGLGAQMLTSQPPMHPGAAATLQMPLNLQQGLPSGVDQQQLPGPIPQPLQQTVQQSPTQVLPQQQAQALQANFPSQQPFSQLQQMQLMQHSNLSQQPNSQLSSTALKQQQVSNSHAAGPAVLVASAVTSPSPSLQLSFQGSALTCSWTEHTSPEGFKYYYNSVTKESKWEKPEEFTIFEQQQKLQQQQQNFAVQQLQLQSQLQLNSQLQSTQQVSQLQQAPQIQLRHAAQLQQAQPSLAERSLLFSSYTGFQETRSTYQTYHGSGAVNTQNIQDLISPQLQGPGSATDNARLQKVPLASQDWMWKNKPTGT